MTEDKQEGIVICPLNQNDVFPKCCKQCIFVIKLLETNGRIGCAIKKNVRLLAERQKIGRKALNKITNLKRRMMNGS